MASRPRSPRKKVGRKQAATVLLSGGLDSTACVSFLQQRRFDLRSVFIDYGQRAARREFQAARAVAAHLGIPLQRIRISPIEVSGTGELPGRNAFLVCAAVLTMRAQPGVVVLGLHAGTPYYDSSEPFLATIAQLTAEMTNGAVSVLAPFISWSKKDVYDYFTSRDLPVDLTYSCEAGTSHPCGACLSCRDRRSLGC